MPKWTMSSKVACYHSVFTLFTFYLCVTCIGDAKSRDKRQVSTELPRIVTKDGHLLFMTGVNHNITFQSGAGGFVNVDGKNLKDFFGKIPDNPDNLKAKLNYIETLLKRVTSSVIPNVQQDVQSFHTQLGTLSNQVQNDLSSKVVQLTQEKQQLKSRSEQMEQRIRDLDRKVETLTSALETNNCQSNPCRNGGSCYNRYNGFNCNCRAGWMGETCEDDVNECSKFYGTDLGCQNGGSCINTPGTYRCQCTADWHGLHCHSRHDDCTGESNSEICGHGTCINQARNHAGQPKYKCICEAGWTHSADSVTCTEDVDECQSATSCFQHSAVQCINFPGSFTCSPCPPGFTGNGFICNDIDECEINNGGCSLNPRVMCLNTQGSRTCGQCPSDYTGNGISCQYVGVCHVNNGGCNSFATCTENPYVIGGRVCSCFHGYTGTGFGPGSCRILAPTENPCLNNPCQNGGTCQASAIGNVTCLCLPNFIGSLCEASVNPCASNPCQNGATCIQTSDSYSCECTSSFSGTTCETQREECGGRFYNPSGMIAYPSQPGVVYPHGIDCEWVIKVSSSKVVQLNFTGLRTECHFDWLDVVDSESSHGSHIGRYCRLSDVPNNGIINSTGRALRLWLHSDSSRAYEGFNVSWTSQEPECGYDIQGSHNGILQSPNYPYNYPTLRTCTWTISMDPGQRITVSFKAFQLEHHRTCNYDYLEIRNGLTSDSPLLGKFCNRTATHQSMVSSGPYLYFKFHSDISATDKGFKLIYYATQVQQEGCGSVANSHSGTLSSPNFPNPYSSNEDCVWIIQPGHTLILTFNNIDLPGEPPCTTDYVEIRDGSSPTSPLIGRYCGQTAPKELISNKNSLWIQFKSGEASSYVGFSLQWTIACGGIFTSPSGILQSPFYGSGGDNSSEELCIFVIRQPPTKKISLLFNEFRRSESDKELQNCTSNYLEIRHGDTKSSPLLGKYCGSDNLPAASVATGLMRIEYKGGPDSLGFKANYTTTNLDCGGIVTGKVGSISSPHRTLDHLNCDWHIIVDPGKLIRLSFTTFHLPACVFNAVELKLKNEGESHVQRYCGYQIPPVFTSKSNRMTLHFITHYKAFRASFHAVFHAINRTNDCGGILKSPAGVVMSPNFPENYPNMIDCIWYIQVATGHRIQLNFYEFDVERHHACLFDSLTVRNGGSSGSPLIGIYCGKKSHFTRLSQGNQLWLRFTSDVYLEKKGFNISYTSAMTGCGGDIVSHTGSIISPNYPDSSMRTFECVWRIHVSAGNKIGLQFGDFHIYTSCNRQSVEVRDPDRHGQQVGRYCGRETPDQLVSSSNSLFILFNVRSITYMNMHFRINYNTVCRDIQLDDISGRIESPGFPNNYMNSESCSWVIKGLYGNTVTIVFSHFELEDHPNCTHDYLTVRDGDKITSPLIDKLCGPYIPRSFTSTGSKLRIDFKTDPFLVYTGFRIEYRQNACIRNDYRDRGRIRFPEDNSMGISGNGSFCIWIIKVEPGMRVQLNVSTLQLDGADSCIDEFLKITDGDTPKAPELATLCFTIRQIALTTSTGNTMTLLYKVRQTTKSRKLRALYDSVSGGCGGTYKLVDGSIQSPNYPNDAPRNSTCNWLIVPKKAHFIVLKFVDFNMSRPMLRANYCMENYLRISQNNEINEAFCNGEAVTGRRFTYESAVLLSFKTGDRFSGRGFKVNYTQECGISYSASNGGIISSDDLQGATSCRWLLIANQSDERVTLHFSKFSSSLDCQLEYVKVYNGIDKNAPLIDTYCGRRIPPIITSSGSGLYIVASKKKKLVFRATYSTSVSSCGGQIYAGTGAISTPSYPENYPMNMQCIWQFKIAPGNRIHLSFSEFSLETYEFCNKDYLEARSVNASGSLIGRFCEGKPQNITTSGNLWLKFRSDEDNTRSGFIANYKQIFGGAISGSSGQISIPDWDSPTYPAVWTITVDEGLVIFIDLKQMSFFTFQDTCVGYLEIRDGLSAESPLIGQYCKDERISLYSSSNQIYLKYAPFRNFKQEMSLYWRAVSNITAIHLVNQGRRTSTPQYSYNLKATDTIQNVMSPGFPTSYAPNLICEWYIYAEKGYHIWINFTTIDLDDQCAFDYIEYRVPLIRIKRSVCEIDQLDGPIEYRSNNIYLTFNSDHVNSGKGFAASFKRKCGGFVIIETSVILSSRNLESDCKWKFSTSIDYKLTATVLFSRYQNNNCTDDFLKINDGQSNDSRPLLASSAGYCQNHTIQIFNTSGSFLYIRLRKDFGPDIKIIVRKKGSDCGGHVVLNNAIPSGYIQTINYPNGYPAKVECEWIISAPGLQRVQIDVKDFASRCPNDFLEFRDGSTINSPRLQRLCGQNRKISTIYSRSNVMYVRFRTKRRGSQKGFRIKYSIAKCGGKIISKSGIIKSDHYPRNYENNMNCKWNIHVREGHFISLDLLDFKLQESANCTADYLEIKEYMQNVNLSSEFNNTDNSSSSVIHSSEFKDTTSNFVSSDDGVLFHGCGQNIPNRIQSSGNELEITFKTDHRKVSQGFTLNFTESIEECGGILENDYGIISSPGYPNTVNFFRRCQWKIRVRPDRSITLRFTDGESLPCRYSFVRAGWSHVCGGHTETIQSNTNEMTITYIHRSNRGVSKFSASYDSDRERLCGGLLTSSSGNITSPEVNNTIRSVQCNWLLQPPIRANMTIVIDVDQQVGNIRCYYRQLQIFEGVDETGKLITKVCGVKMRKRIVLSSRSLFIVYRYLRPWWKTFPRSGGILSMRYSSSDCGGILTDDSGEITSPHFPGSYPIDCNWKITGASNSKLNISVMEFDLENSTNCEKDFVNILNGGNHDSPSIAKICGHQNPISYITETNKASIQFHSEYTTGARGFRIRYVVDRQVCGGYHHGMKGRIMSPNYPHSYPAQKECIWKIKATPGYTIHLKFLPPFDLERSTNCQNDYVMIEAKLQGNNEFQQKKFCDFENIKDQIYISRPEMTITFKSNNRISGTGFLIDWESVCGGQFYEQSGYIVSPRKTNIYPNMRCTYMIMSEPESYFMLNIEELNLRHFTSYLRLQFGRNFSEAISFWWSHRVPPMLLKGPIRITYVIYGKGTSDSFKIFYERTECGVVYTAASGHIENRKYNGKTINNMNCTYLIKVDEDMAVYLRFTEFRIEQHSSCSYDYMAVYDGNTTSSPLIGRFCGLIPPPEPIKSSTNQLLLHFVTSHYSRSVGFKAIYQTGFGHNVGCGGDLGNSTGLLRSIDINNDGLYENSLYCHWRITVDFDKVVKLTFESFDVQSSSNCEKDSLTILSHMKKTKYCGYQIPQPITSVSNVMEVWFKTDASNQRSGFTATYTSILNYCGGGLLANETEKTIANPTRASLYQPHYGTPKCRWTIVAPDNYQIRIKVTQMDLLQNCTGEYLQIREPTIPHYSYKYCGQEVPNVYYSHTPSVEINFITQALSESEKFSLQYSLADCNRNYNAPSGELFSPGWPGRYKHAARCKMNITSPVGTKLSLYFYAFALEYDNRCAYDYLQVKYFTNSTHRQTTKFCSFILPFPIFSSSNRIELYFRSDTSFSHEGFHVIFTSTMQDSGCGGNLTIINGTFTSPNYPALYPETAPSNTVPQEKECQWNIRVPTGRQINLVFADFSLGQNSNVTNCITNYVKIYTGIRSRNTLYTTECSDNIPDSIISTSNVMTVVMASDGIAQTPKFRIRYTS